MRKNYGENKYRIKISSYPTTNLRSIRKNTNQNTPQGYPANCKIFYQEGKMKFITLILIVFISNQLFGQQQVPDLKIDLLFRDNPNPPYGGSELLSFGLDSTATDGIDEHLGESDLPPDVCPNLAGVFCAKFILPNNIESSLVDFRFGTFPFTGQKIHKSLCRTFQDYSYVIIYNLPPGVTINLTDVINGLIFNETITDSGQIIIPDIGSGFLLDLLILVNYNNVVPIELTSFTASVLQNEKAVQLNWTTATETNNSGFEIQRSPSLIPSQREGTSQTPLWGDWGAVGFVPGFGTTTEPKSYSFIDENIPSGTYKYRLKQINYDGSFEYSNEIEVGVDFTPQEFLLYQNYPNPFNPTTTIKFEIPKVKTHRDASLQIVTLKVYDILGNEVATLVNEEKQPGVYEVQFDASSLASGMYLYKLQAGSFVQTKKMILLR